MTGLLAVALAAPARAAEVPTPEMLRVLEPQPEGPRITPYLAYQLERAWAFDAARQERFARVRTEADLRPCRTSCGGRPSPSSAGCPERRRRSTPASPARSRWTATASRSSSSRACPASTSPPSSTCPTARRGRSRPCSLACGHSPVGKAYPGYQEIAVRLARRGYVVLCWDPVGQGERSQFWDAARGRSRYNLVCGEHAVLGNLATIAGTSLVRYMVWDGMRAVDYLLTRDDVDGEPARDHGHERRRLPGALDRRPRPAHRRRPAVLLPDRAAHADGEPHLRGPRQRPRAGPAGPRLRGDRPPGPPPPRVPAAAPRLRGGPRLLPDRGHAQDDARGRGLLPPLRPRRPRRAQRGLPQAPVLGREPGEGVRVPRPRLRPAASTRASARRRRSRPRPCGARRAARCARTSAGAR